MVEPTTTSTAAWAVAVAATGAFLTSIGVSWPVVFWATLGGMFGMTWAPAMGRARSILIFPSSSLLSAKAGILVSLTWFAGAESTAGAVAAVVAIVFHPAMTLMVASLPALANKWLGLNLPTDKS